MLNRVSAVTRAGVRNFNITNPAAHQIGILQRPGESNTRLITVIPGSGIGPELVNAAMVGIEATGAPIDFDVIGNSTNSLTNEALASLRRTKVGLKGEFNTGIGPGTPVSANIQLRKTMDLYANVVHSFNIPGVPSRHKNVDIVIIRENTEGEYSGMEHEVYPGVTESLKVMTRDATLRIARYAFEYAYLNNRSKVTAVHKANIMKRADGIFLESCKEVAAEFPTVQYEEVIVDNCMMQLVSKPQQFDVLVTPNFYGSLVTNTVAGLVGGAAIAPGGNIGNNCAVFEQGARHLGMDIAGKGVANPTGILFSSVMMLRHCNLPVFADRLENAIFKTIESGCVTPDLKGRATTNEFMQEIAKNIKASKLVKDSKGESKSV